MKPSLKLYPGDLQKCRDLDSMIEEADSPIIPHIEKVVMRGVRRVIVHSNDPDVVVFLLYYIRYFINLGIEDLWIKFGIGDKSKTCTSSQIGGCSWYSTLQIYFEISCPNWL